MNNISFGRLSPFPAALRLCVLGGRREIAGETPPDWSGSCGSCTDATFYVFAGWDNRQCTKIYHSVGLRYHEDDSCLCRCSAVPLQSSTACGGKWLMPREQRHRHGAIAPAGCTQTGDPPKEGKADHPFVIYKANQRYTHAAPVVLLVFAVHLDCMIHTSLYLLTSEPSTLGGMDPNSCPRTHQLPASLWKKWPGWVQTQILIWRWTKTTWSHVDLTVSQWGITF